MRLLVIGLSALVAAGCSTSRSHPPIVAKGFSHYISVVRGNSNMPSGYKDYPVYQEGGKNFLFGFNAREYLKGVENDLKLIDAMAKDASDKIRAVADSVALGGSLVLGRVSPQLLLGSSESNVPTYREFPEFNTLLFYRPTPPSPPITRDAVSVRCYNMDVDIYNQDLLDYSATLKAYVEDGNHYIRNCKNDYETVRKKGDEFVLYLKKLETSGVKVDLGY